MSDVHDKAVAIIERSEGRNLHPLVEAAVTGGGVADPATLRELLDLQMAWEKNEARKAYVAALVRVKAALPATVRHDARHGKKGYTYATLGQLMDAVTLPLAQHGFSLGGDATVAGDVVTVTVTLTHSQGHSEQIALPMPVDRGAASKTTGEAIHSPAEAIAGAITRGRRHATALLLGLATAPVPDAEARPDAVDLQATLRVFGGAVAKYGVTRAAAEAELGRPLPQWTLADLERLRVWAAGQGTTATPEPSGGEQGDGE